MKKYIFNQFVLILVIIITSGIKTMAQVTAKDCTVAVNVCTNNSFSVSPAGGGFVDFTTGFTISNPIGNPVGIVPAGGMGCLKAGELNPTWMIINIQTAGTLEFSMGAGVGAGAQSGCYDWIMWQYLPTTCSGINANTQPPVRCCWNSFCSGGTGLASAANLPAGGNAPDFGAPLNVNCGDKYIMCFSNYSGVTTLVPLNFFGTAIVSCSPVSNTLSINSASICPGSVATLSVATSPGTTYTWQPGGSNNTTITVSPASTTIYTLSATNACGILTGTTAVIVSPPLSLNLTSTNGNCALGTSGSATVTPSGGIPGYTYSWSPSGGVGNAATNLSSGTYTVKVTDALGCTATSATTIIAPLPLTFSVNSTIGSFTLSCNPPTLTINAVNTSTLTNVTFTWTPGGFVGNSLTVSTPGVYIVMGQDQTVGSCLVTQTISVVQNTAAPTVTVNPITGNLSCNGAPACFTAICTPTLNVQGQWFAPGPVAVGGLSNSPLLGCFNAPGTYTALFTNITNGCVGTATVSVTSASVVPTMTVNALNGYVITCSQPCLVMNISTSSTLAPKSYSWTNLSTTVTTTPPTGGYTICTPGNYLAEFQDGNFCRISQMITVSIDTLRPSPSAISGLPSNSYTLDCNHACITPTAISNPLMGPGSYSWTAPPNLTINSNTISICLANITSSTTATNYTVIAIGPNGCIGKAKIQFYKNIYVPPYTAVLTPSAITCVNQCVAMSPQTTTSVAVTFTFVSPAPTTTNNTAGAQFCVPGTYTMNYTNVSNGCQGTYTNINVPLNATPPATVSLSTATIPCGSNTVNLTAGTTSNLATYQYNWVGPIGSGLSNPNGYTTSVNMSGYYLVSITNTVNGCRSTNEVNVVQGGLNVSFIANPLQGFSPLAVNFNNTSSLGATGTGTIYTWWGYGNGATNSYTNTSVSGSPNGSTTYPTAGTYTVLLVVTQSVTVAGNTTGCSGTATALVVVDLPSKINVPNIFTPNGDGVNDVFQLLSTNLTDISCVIFDRWGVKMYDVSSDKGNIGWDGKTLFGKDAPSGTYFFIIKATGKDGNTFEEKGSVGLYR